MKLNWSSQLRLLRQFRFMSGFSPIVLAIVSGHLNRSQNVAKKLRLSRLKALLKT